MQFNKKVSWEIYGGDMLQLWPWKPDIVHLKIQKCQSYKSMCSIGAFSTARRMRGLHWDISDDAIVRFNEVYEKIEWSWQKQRTQRWFLMIFYFYIFMGCYLLSDINVRDSNPCLCPLPDVHLPSIIWIVFIFCPLIYYESGPQQGHLRTIKKKCVCGGVYPWTCFCLFFYDTRLQ